MRATPKMVGFPNKPMFSLLEMISTWGVKLGYHHLRKHPYIIHVKIRFVLKVDRKTCEDILPEVLLGLNKSSSYLQWRFIRACLNILGIHISNSEFLLGKFSFEKVNPEKNTDKKWAFLTLSVLLCYASIFGWKDGILWFLLIFL